MSILTLACDLARPFEGLGDGDKATPGLQPYRDSCGYWTIGYGHLLSRDPAIHEPDITWTEDQAEEDLQDGMAQRVIWVMNNVRVAIGDGAFAALADFAYNLGIGSLQSSTLLRKLNRGDIDGAADEFPKWRRGGGRILPGLVRRRAAERRLFLAQ